MRSALTIALVMSAGCSIFGDWGGYAGPPVTADASPPSSVDAAEEASLSPDAGAADSNAPSPDTFIDDFNRPAGAVGNGWIEKTSGIFSIQNESVVAKTGNWQEAVLYRPASEDLLDVEVSIELRWNGTTPCHDCDPALLARVSSANVTGPDGVTAYAAFVDDTKDIAVQRLTTGSNATHLKNVPLPAIVDTASTYRLTFRVTGTTPVLLTATVEKKDPTSQAWTALATLTHEDSSNARLQTAGSVGFTSDSITTFAYDTFVRKKL